MNNFEFYDNSIVNYIPVVPEKPVCFFIPTEESLVLTSQDTNNVTTKNNPNTYVSTTGGFTLDKTQVYVTPGSNSPAHYVGVSTYNVPCILDSIFVDFKISSLSINSEDLFLTDDEKIKVLGNKFHLVKIPANRFKDSLSNSYNYSDYFLQISPKYIETTVTSVILKSHVDYATLVNVYNSSSGEYLKHNRRNIYEVNRSDFSNSVWNFENTSYYAQKGRLFGSVVEIYNSSGILKNTKFIAENNLNFSTSVSKSQLCVSPDYIGIGDPEKEINIGDVLRIYPVETYFNPIQVVIGFKNISKSPYNVTQYLTNDVVRDLTSGVFEIYDDSGVVIEKDGTVSGTVLSSYQVLKLDSKEIRIKNKV